MKYKPPITLVGILDNVRSRYNVGAIFRTADGLGVLKLYLCGITPKPDNEDDRVGITKTALGAEKSVPWIGIKETTEAIKQLKRDGFNIIALETDVHGNPLNSLTTDYLLPTTKIALIVGHEVFGIHRNVLDLADYIMEIPMKGSKESLNVEVAFAIAAYTIANVPKP